MSVRSNQSVDPDGNKKTFTFDYSYCSMDKQDSAYASQDQVCLFVCLFVTVVVVDDDDAVDDDDVAVVVVVAAAAAAINVVAADGGLFDMIGCGVGIH